MVLVDTSVWVFHLRETHAGLVDLLDNGKVACHPFIIGELACGNLKNRTTILSLLEALPMAFLVEHEEVLAFIENHNLMGKGLGYIDVHLLASAVLTGLLLWTRDKKLEKAAEELHCEYRWKLR
jgi:predicted nucleic acid-binding protein